MELREISAYHAARLRRLIANSATRNFAYQPLYAILRTECELDKEAKNLNDL